jgi:hypothetical protein
MNMPHVVVEGVSFVASVAADVRRIADAARVLAGSDCVYVANNQLRAAITPQQGIKDAQGVFVMIEPTTTGATVVRPTIPKSGNQDIKLNSSTIAEVISQMGTWYQEVRRLTVPEEIEPMEDKLFVSGGRVESDRSKF